MRSSAITRCQPITHYSLALDRTTTLRSRYRRMMKAIVVVAGSAGGLKPLRHLIAGLPVGCTASVFVVMHIGNNPTVLPSLLTFGASLPPTFAQDGELVHAGHVYVAPPDYHLLLEADRIRLSHAAKVHHTRPAADPLFISAAQTYLERVIGIVLSGGGADGAAGLRAIKEHGGATLVQLPDEATNPSMPRAAILAGHPDACLPIQGIVQRVTAFCSPV